MMNRRKLISGIVFTGLLAAFALAQLSLIQAEPPQGKPAPAWTLKDLKGKPVSLSDYKGHVVLLDFWATWCPPCVESIPELISLQKKYGKDGLKIVGVSADDDVPTVQAWVKQTKTKFNYDIVMADKEITDAYQVEGFPTLFVIDADGNLAKYFRGQQDKSDIESVIKPLLKAAPKTNQQAAAKPAEIGGK